MKRWFCIMLSLILLVGGLMPTETALAGIFSVGESGKAANSSLNDTFPTIDGGTVSLREDASKDVTVLIFGQTICDITGNLLKSIAQSGWIHESNVRVIFAESSRANEAVTRHFVKRYGCEEMTACYSVTGGISECMWNYLGAGGSASYPVVVLLDKNGKVKEILNACSSAGDLYQAMRKFAEINGSEEDAKLEQKIELSVMGEESYEDAEKVVRIMNQGRALEGVGAVELDEELMETAMIRAAELTLYYSHVRPSGDSCFTIFRSSSYHAENIAAGQKTAQDVMDAWMKSEGHHANIVNPKFKSVGIGCFTDNNGRKYWVQCFDDGQANEPKKYGVHKVQRNVRILESHIHLEAVNRVLTISCADNAENAKIMIQNKNETDDGSTPIIQASDLIYSSSDSQVAEADENGAVIVNSAGSVVITASLKESSDINVKINVTKKEHNYVRVSGENGGGRYICENCGTVQGGGSSVNVSKAEIDAGISVTPEKSTVKIIDARTKKPISLVRIWVGGEFWTDKNGIVNLSQVGMTTIQLEKEGYYKKTVKKELKKGQSVVIMLCPNMGDLQVVSASLNMNGEDKDVLDDTFTVFDKNLDGDANITATNFTLYIEAAGNPMKYELIQNGKVVQESADGIFTLSGYYSNSKKGTVSYYLKDFSAGYRVIVRIFDKSGKHLNQKLGIKVAKASSSVTKTLKQLEEGADSKAKVEFGKKVSMTIPSDIPIMGGTELNFGFEDKLPIQVSFDAETGLVRVALNMGEFDTGDSKKWYKKKEEFQRLKNQVVTRQKMGSAFGGDLEPFGAGMFSVKGSIMGYGEGYLLDNTDSLRVNLGVVVGINAEKKYAYYYFLPSILIPVYVSFNGGASCNVFGEVNLDIGNSKIQMNGGSLELQPSIYVKPEAGIGAEGIMSFSAYGKIEFALLYRCLDNYGQATISGTAGLKRTLLWGTEEWDLWSGTKVLYDSNNKSVSRNNQLKKFNMSNPNITDFVPISMKYLSKRTEAADRVGNNESVSAEESHSDSTRILNYAYEGASPKLIHAGNKLYLFYLDGIEGRSEPNQTALVYQISSDDGETWSKAMRADNGRNETADYHFDVAVKENEIYVIWSDSGSVYGDEFLSMDFNEAIAKTGKEMNLMLSVIDGSDGSVRRVSSLGTRKADLQPKIAVGNDGTIYAAWITNDVSSEDGLISSENHMGIGYASSKDNYTTHEMPLSEKFYPMTLDMGMLRQEMCAAVSLDTDADLSTQEDREIYMVHFDAEKELLAQTSNDKIDSAPTFGKLAGKNTMFWYQDGNIAYTSDGENVNFVFGEENFHSIGQEFSLLEGENGDAAIVWESASLAKDIGVDVYCTDFDGSAWSNAYKLGELDSEYTGTLSGCLAGSDYQIVYLGSKHEGKDSFSHICMYMPKERTDTSVIWEESENGIPGETYSLNLIITNNGNKTVESLSIVSKDGSIQDEITGVSIVPGSSLDIVWEGIRLPEKMTEVYESDLIIKAEGEEDLADNEINLSVGAPDFSVEAYQDFSSGEQFAGIVITNNGMVSSDAILTVYKNEQHTEKLYETKMSQVQGGESRIVMLDLTILDSENPIFYFDVTDAGDMEIYKEDNQAMLYIARGIYLDYKNNFNTEDKDTETPEQGGQELDKPGDAAENLSVPVIKSFKVKAGRKKLIFSWKKCSDVSGYQIQISEKKNFKGAKIIAVSKSRKKYTKKKLKTKKKYYIRIRAYKTYQSVQGKNLKVCGKWKTVSKKTK